MIDVQMFLNRYRICVRDLQYAVRQLSEMDDRALATGSLAPKEVNVKSSPSLSARFEEVVNDKADLERIIADEIENAKRIRREIISVIELVEDARQKEVLMMRYVRLYSYKKIAKIMNYSERNVHKLHKSAVEFIAVQYHDVI